MADATGVSRGGGRVDVAAAVCVVCGVLGAVLAGYLAEASGTVGVYPHPVSGSAALQIVLALCRIGLLLGLLSLRASGVVPASRGARTAHYAAVAVLAGLTVAEGIAISVPVSASGPTPRAFAVVYACYTALLGIALLVLGVEVVRRGSWQGPRRWLTAVLGLWLLVAVLPALAFAPASAGWAVAAWMLLFALLGLALVRRRQQHPTERAAFPARAYAAVTWVYVAAFGSSSVPVAASLLESGRLPSFFGVPHVRRSVVDGCLAPHPPHTRHRLPRPDRHRRVGGVADAARLARRHGPRRRPAARRGAVLVRAVPADPVAARRRPPAPTGRGVAHSGRQASNARKLIVGPAASCPKKGSKNDFDAAWPNTP